MVSFSVDSVRGIYDYDGTSAYMSKFTIGNAKGKLLQTLNHGTAPSFELEGKLWQIGYASSTNTAHAKKKWQLSKHNLLVVRQDLPGLRLGVLPSPEIQLESEVTSVGGMDKNKLELKYHTFWKRATIEEEATKGKFKFTASMASDSRLGGAKVGVRAKFQHKWLDEVSLTATRAKPLCLMYRLKPLRGSALKVRAQPFARDLACDVEYEFDMDRIYVEATATARKGAFEAKRLAVGFAF